MKIEECPYCKNKKLHVSFTPLSTDMYEIVCKVCNYRSASYPSKSKVISTHNRISRLVSHDDWVKKVESRSPSN